MNNLPDEEILIGLRSPDEQENDKALKQLYAQHYPIIAAFIAKNNGTEADAADMFQDAIIIFYEKVRFGQLKLNCSIQTYIYSVCKNLWMNRLRKQKKMVSINDDMRTIPVSDDSLTIIETNDRQRILIQLISRLGEDCKKVLTHYYFDRLRMKEIAQRMEFANEQVAKNKKSACMKKLKALVFDSPTLKNILE